MKVSVIVPAYNEQKYIKECLACILNQTVRADEIIVVDNNSTDQTAIIARKMGAKVAREAKQGMIHARNKGFDTAKYEIIARCDADTRVPPYWIERIKYNFEAYRIDALSGPVLYYDYYIRSPLPARIYSNFLKLLLCGNEVLIGPNMSVTRNIWQKIKPLVCLEDKVVHEDVDLSINISKIGGKIRHDTGLAVKTSARRVKKDHFSFFVEYPIRLIKTFWVNRK